jgi:hypothetical protein
MVTRMVAMGMRHKGEGTGSPRIQPKMITFGKVNPAFISHLNHDVKPLRQQASLERADNPVST